MWSNKTKMCKCLNNCMGDTYHKGSITQLLYLILSAVLWLMYIVFHTFFSVLCKCPVYVHILCGAPLCMTSYTNYMLHICNIIQFNCYFIYIIMYSCTCHDNKFTTFLCSQKHCEVVYIVIYSTVMHSQFCFVVRMNQKRLSQLVVWSPVRFLGMMAEKWTARTRWKSYFLYM